MFSLLKKASSYLFGSAESEIQPAIDIDSIIAALEVDEVPDGQPCISVTSDVELVDTDCQHRIGTVTSLFTNYGLIDETLYFDLRDAVPELRVGDRVAFLVYRRGQNEDWRVRKIFCVQDENWDKYYSDKEYIEPSESVSEVQCKNSMKRRIIGKVTQRRGREVIVTPGNIRCNLDDVVADFVPIIGDWIALDAVVEVNEEVCDLGGDLLDVEKIRPLRSRVVTDYVSHWNQDCGVIKDIYFTRDDCEPGYIPSLGDKVIAEAIESEQEKFKWRALTVVSCHSRDLKSNSALQERQKTKESCMINIEMQKLLQNKRGLVITENLDFGVLQMGEKRELVAIIRNTSSWSQFFLRGKFHSRRSESQFVLRSPQEGEVHEIQPGQEVEFYFGCKGRFFGKVSELFVFTFKGFKIGRNIQVEVQDCLHTCIMPSENKNCQRSPVQKNPYKSRKGMLVSGVRPIKTPAFVAVKLGEFPIPERIWEAVLGTDGEKRCLEDVEAAVENVVPCLASDLKISNYCERFHALLYLEEIELKLNMERYDMKNVCFRLAGPGGEFLSLEVPGLAEKRPSLLLGDRVIASSPNEGDAGIQFEGYIHKIFGKEIWIKFNSNFHSSYSGSEYDVSFHSSRTPLRRCHAAVNMALTHLGPQMLFPATIKVKTPQLNLEEEMSEDILTYSHKNAVIQGIETCNTAVPDGKHHADTILSCVKSPDVSSPSKLCTDIQKSPPRVPVVVRLFGLKTSSDLVQNNTLHNIKDCQVSNDLLESSDMHSNNTGPQRKFALVTGMPEMEHSNTSVNHTENNLPNREESIQTCLSVDNNFKSEMNIPDFRKRKIKWFNNRLNFFQKEAVRNVLKGEARPLPYVIFGPPGTGKTVTLVETILQILTLLPDSRLLVATPSNSSADLIAERLLDSGILLPGDLVRLVGYHYIDEGKVPEKLIPYSTTGDTNLFRKDPSFSTPMGVSLQNSSNAHTLGRHRITVGTCIALGQLYVMGFERGHFTHVFVDEAGQATEPEILVPLDFIHTSSGQVVLAGDPLQLGPVITSPLALRMGLGESYLSRLMHHFPYQRDQQGFPESGGYNSRVIVRLVFNYRSVPELLSLPNQLFYDSALEPKVSQTVGPEAELLASLASKLPQRKKNSWGPPALVFHGVRGENYQEGESPSWFNPQEVVQVLYYINILYDVGLSSDDVGIITPYQKQVQKIRILLEELDVPIPKIGSVEEFQGQERKVIILSAVRSNITLLKTDVRHALGFVASPKRLNVALTRARALLIIVGNPHLLTWDPVWRSVLNYCVEHEAYIGCDLPIDYGSLALDLNEE
ncbi:probable RNA helicase armi [Periplaneta americana]|uniref:probable RNA helicase armi n=1 Tax=Periplaneta americana TaxID=6978 RepID=UPI0037E972E3